MGQLLRAHYIMHYGKNNGEHGEWGMGTPHWAIGPLRRLFTIDQQAGHLLLRLLLARHIASCRRQKYVLAFRSTACTICTYVHMRG